MLNLWNGIKGVTEVETDLFCIPKQMPNSTKWFGCVYSDSLSQGAYGAKHSSTVVINQCLLWVLTFHKYRNAVKGGWSKHPIIRVVMRDNSWACIIMSGDVVRHPNGRLVTHLPTTRYRDLSTPLLISRSTTRSCHLLVCITPPNHTDNNG